MSSSSTATPVTVIALVRAKPGKEGELRQILSSMVAPTRAEAGCLNYELHQSADDATRFAFHENWTTKADLDRHLASPHVTAALAKVGPLLAEAPQITLWGRIA
ncbi:MAG: putative quinol monooxygenase [Limisphaerales bacterium]